MNSDELLQMIGDCPEGSETLIARIVHLLTERNPPSLELVERVRNLHLKRNTDVRSLIPILTGLSKKELLDLIPKFVLSATNSKSVPAFFKKLIFGRHIQNNEPLISAVELIVELHKIKTANFKEYGHLIYNLDLLMVDQSKEFNLTKEVFANSIEQLIEEEPFPPLLFHSFQKIYENYPALNGFLSNVFVKLAQKRVWDENKDLWQSFLKCSKVVGSVVYMAVVTQLSLDEFKEYAEFMNQSDLLVVLKKFISLLSAHQQNSISKPLVEYINEEVKAK
jgi:symplekin